MEEKNIIHLNSLNFTQWEHFSGDMSEKGDKAFLNRAELHKYAIYKKIYE